MAYGDGTGWDETLPLDSRLISGVPTSIRDVNLAHTIRAEKEHNTYDIASAGGEHKAGSAKAYAQTTYPTKRPDGTTDLVTADKGRLLVRTDDGHLEYWDGTGWFKVKVTALEQLADGLITKNKIATGFTAGVYPYAVIVDQKSNGVDGGTLTSGSFAKRTLGTILCDAGTNVIDLTSSVITLNAGVYRIRASCPAYQVDQHQARWRDTTNNATIQYGDCASAPSGVAVMTRSELTVEFTVADDATTFELQHRVTTTKASTGGGVAAGFSAAEFYSKVEIWKLL